MWVCAFLRQPATAVPSLLALGHHLQPERPLGGQLEGVWAARAYFWNSFLSLGFLKRGPEDLLAALRGVVGIWAQVSAPACRLASSPCRHPSGEV